MSIFSYNYLDRTRKTDLSSFSDNFSKKGYNWDDIKKQMTGSVPEKPQEPAKFEQQPSEITRDNSWSFFNNPRSEWEDKRKSMVEDYRKEMHAKFQEKIEKDKKPKYIEKREFYSSISTQPKPPEDPRSSLSYNKSVIMTSSIDLSQSELPNYYSPQVRPKYIPEPSSNPYTNSYQNPFPESYPYAAPPQNPYSYQNPSQNNYLKSYAYTSLSPSHQSPNLKSYVPEKPAEPVAEYSKTNLTSDQSKSIRERQLEEWKRSVQTQLEERNKTKEEQKSKKLLEDKLEEAKIKREVDELNKKYQQEIRYESGFTVEESYQPAPYRPPPKVEEREAAPPLRQPFRQPTRPKEDYKIKHDLVLQEAGIRDIILKIKSEASHAAAERNEILIELDRMKAELRNTRIYDPFTNSSAYYRPYKPPENKFVTLSSAGKNIINGSRNQYDELQSKSKYISKRSDNHYHDIDSPEVKNQLSKLDDILSSQIDERSVEEENKDLELDLEKKVIMIENDEKREEIDNRIKVFQTEVEEDKLERDDQEGENIEEAEIDEAEDIPNPEDV